MENKSKKYLIAVLLILGIGIVAVIFSQRSNESGSTPKNLKPAESISHGHGLAVDVADPAKVYVATHYGLLVLINEKDLYQVGKSKDDLMGFSTHPTDPKIFFSSGHPSLGGNLGFQKSEDAGFTWKKISDGLNGPVDFHTMAVSPANPDLIYGWSRYLQRTIDGGKGWERIPTAFSIVQLTADTKDENIVYAATPQGLQKSSDKGQTWELLFDGFVSAVAVNPASQNLLSFSQKFGLARSNDGGVIWEKINQSFNGETPLFISFSRQRPELVFLLTEKNSLYKSSDSGNTWGKIR